MVKLGVWVSNTKTRRDKLSADQLAALAKLGGLGMIPSGLILQPKRRDPGSRDGLPTTQKANRREPRKSS
ncbi:helicase associated domain-containing protein [Streptomyces toxytricini]|uniref:helicase associated domain-containing protein n=1 Tax=Streptomyces toxytricini TaxID=67369 RepID=UPI003F4D9D03